MERLATLYHRLPVGEILRFGVVGIVATFTHFLVLTLAVERGGMAPTPANGLAFCVAVFVTYIGQSYWVFQKTDHSLLRVQKFLGTAIGGLCANIGIMWLTVNALQLPYLLGFAAALVIVPAATFAINKAWVFSGAHMPGQTGATEANAQVARAPTAVQADRVAAWSASAVALLCVLPFLVTPVLPFTDFYAHAARYYILSHIDASPVLARSYVAAWQMLPNLGMDVIGTGLMGILPPLLAAKMIAVVTALAPFAGVIALARALGRPVPVLAAALGGIAVFNHILIWGFANFLLGIGLGFVGLALWIALSDRPWRQWSVTAVLGLVLFFVHGLAFALWGLLLGMVELARALEARDLRLRSLGWRVVRLAGLAVIPALLFTQMPTAGAEGGVTQAFDNMRVHADAGRAWSEIANEISQRIDNLLRVADAGWPAVDRLLGALLWGGLAAALWFGAVTLDRRLWGAVGLVALLCIALPPNLFGVGYLDDRMPLILLLLLAAGLHPAPGIGLGRIVTAAAMGMFALRLVLVTAAWAGDGRVYRDFLDVLDRVPAGNLAAPVFFDDTGHRGFAGTSCKPLSFLLLLRQGTPVPTFAFDTQQPLRLDGPMAAARAVRPRTDHVPLGTRTPPQARAHILQDMAASGFDTVVACAATPAPPPPAGIAVLAEGAGWTLYRTDRTGP